MRSSSDSESAAGSDFELSYAASVRIRELPISTRSAFHVQWPGIGCAKKVCCVLPSASLVFAVEQTDRSANVAVEIMAAYRNTNPILEEVTFMLDAVETPGGFDSARASFVG